MACFDPDTAEWVVRVVYDGPARVGKTANLRHLCRPGTPLDVREAEIEALERTVTFDWVGVRAGALAGASLRLQIVCTPGLSVFRKRRQHILASADIVVLVCHSALSSRASIEAMITEGRVVPSSRRRRPLIVQANWQDDPQALSVAELREALHLPRTVPCISAQANDGVGVDETLELARGMAERLVQRLVERGRAGDLRRRAQTSSELREALRELDAVPRAPRVSSPKPPATARRGDAGSGRGDAAPRAAGAGRAGRASRASRASRVGRAGRAPSPSSTPQPSSRPAAEEPTQHHPTEQKESTMSAETMMKRAMKEIPKCVAAGIVDLDSGMLLNVKTVDSHPQEVLDLVAAATKDLYEGDNVTAIEDAFKRTRGVRSDEHYFQQIMVLSTNLIHFFARLQSDQGIVLVAVCRKDANLGLVLAKAKSIALSERV